MAIKIIGVRVNVDLANDLEREAKFRDQSVSGLIRQFIRDGLSGYDDVGNKLLETQHLIESHLKVIELIAGANLHSTVEFEAFKISKKNNETEAEYLDRINLSYKKTIKTSMDKGERISKFIRDEKI